MQASNHFIVICYDFDNSFASDGDTIKFLVNLMFCINMNRKPKQFLLFYTIRNLLDFIRN